MNGLDITISDIVNLVAATEIAINKKVYSREQIEKFFPSWNNIAANLEKHRRHLQVQELYKEQAHNVPVHVPGALGFGSDIVPVHVPEVHQQAAQQ